MYGNIKVSCVVFSFGGGDTVVVLIPFVFKPLNAGAGFIGYVIFITMNVED